MRIPSPTLGRVTLVLLGVVAAATAYPWHTVRERWVLGVAVIVVLSVVARWRGLHLTTIVRRRLALGFRRRRSSGAHQLVDYTPSDARTTAVLRLLDGTQADVPLDLIVGYLDRYGVRCDSLRVTSRDTAEGRTTWIGLTMSAAANLTALQARSAALPLRETAEITLRRLADHLRELGWIVTTSDVAIPDLLGPAAKERWRAVADGGQGYVAGYRIAAASLADTVAGLWSQPFDELWTAIELSPGGVAAACAIRTDNVPSPAPPLPGLTLLRGSQWQSLAALVPSSTKPLDAEVVPMSNLAAVRWPATGVPVGP